VGAGSVGTQDYRISMLRPASGLVIAEASGEIDVTSSSAFAKQLLALLDERPARIVVDLSSVAYVDTYVLSALVDLAMRCRREHCELALVCCEGRMRRALARTGMDQFVATHATLTEALGPGPA
jgi:anti-sigma B factor antagonist